jgi:hypothetical protein
MVDRWGTRCTRSGKVIWTEQTLPSAASASSLSSSLLALS